MVTTPEPVATKSPRPLLPVGGVVIALAVAVGVWLLPSDMVDPAAGTVRLRPIDGGGGSPETWEPSEAYPWSELTASREELREPDREAPPEITTDDPDDETKPPEPRSTVLRPPWSYEGLITEPRGRVAVIRTQEGQRLIYEGDTIRHTDRRAGGVLWTVQEASPERLVLRSDETEYEYQMLNVGPSQVPGQTSRRERPENTPLPAAPPEEVGRP